MGKQKEGGKKIKKRGKEQRVAKGEKGNKEGKKVQLSPFWETLKSFQSLVFQSRYIPGKKGRNSEIQNASQSCRLLDFIGINVADNKNSLHSFHRVIFQEVTGIFFSSNNGVEFQLQRS